MFGESQGKKALLPRSSLRKIRMIMKESLRQMTIRMDSDTASRIESEALKKNLSVAAVIRERFSNDDERNSRTQNELLSGMRVIASDVARTRRALASFIEAFGVFLESWCQVARPPLAQEIDPLGKGEGTRRFNELLKRFLELVPGDSPFSKVLEGDVPPHLLVQEHAESSASDLEEDDAEDFSDQLEALFGNLTQAEEAESPVPFRNSSGRRQIPKLEDLRELKERRDLTGGIKR